MLLTDLIQEEKIANILSLIHSLNPTDLDSNWKVQTIIIIIPENIAQQPLFFVTSW